MSVPQNKKNQKPLNIDKVLKTRRTNPLVRLFRRYPILSTFALVFTGIQGAILFNGYRYANKGPEDITAKVTDISTVNNGGLDVMIVNTDKGQFMNINESLSSEFNESADLRGKIHKDSTYVFKVEGMRNETFNAYPNIIAAKPVRTPGR